MLNEPNSTLDDAELQKLVVQIHSESPSLGESMMCGRLRASGYKVSRERIRNVMRSTDPLGAALRWPGGATKRRPYSVSGPNSLWHIGMLCEIHGFVHDPVRCTVLFSLWLYNYTIPPQYFKIIMIMYTFMQTDTTS